jgi:hypothetical protein
MSFPTQPPYAVPDQQPAPRRRGHAVWWIVGLVATAVVFGSCGLVVGSAGGGGDVQAEPANEPAEGVDVEPADEPAPEEPAAEEPPAEEAPAEEPADDLPPGFNDVVIDACPPSEFETITVPLTVTSTADADSSYTIEIAITDDAGTLLGTGVAFVERLAPGQVAKTEAFASVSADGQFTCTVSDVERYGSF